MSGSYFDAYERQVCVYGTMMDKISLRVNGICPLQIEYNTQTGEVRK
jgi:hypothetical protein